MADRCPICDDPASCKGYPFLWERLAEDRAAYEPIHAVRNGLACFLTDNPARPALGVPLGGCCH